MDHTHLAYATDLLLFTAQVLAVCLTAATTATAQGRDALIAREKALVEERTCRSPARGRLRARLPGRGGRPTVARQKPSERCYRSLLAGCACA